jgi:protocatechuate 3,4-dioxygenase beta subunit
MSSPLSRRDALGLIGAAGLGIALVGCSDDDSPESSASTTGDSGSTSTAPGDSTSSTPTTASTGTTGATPTAVDCVLTPEQTEGPYYLDDAAVRRDITEGRPGAPLRLLLLVADASSCTPIPGAAVDLWHADAGGVYSGFDSGSGETFLRGIQETGADGIARFDTLYPGWYQGRTVHLHVKVHVSGDTVHTGQLYFDDAVTDNIYALAPYSSRANRTTRNTDDGIFGNGGSSSIVAISGSGSALQGAITLGVRV